MADGTAVRVRRVYDNPEPDDGSRVLVDRVWPRGLSKERAGLHRWLKEVAPSTELRRWYGHDPERYVEFAERYRRELEDPERASALEELRSLTREGTVTLLTATKDVEHSQATVLSHILADG